ncbi:MAG: amino acid adenylation domain-containing protein [Methylobacter sp.]|nr:amino acid adenylation domain-containing protein [Methylobacter sp.]
MLLKPFLHQCRQQPEAVALVESDRYLSYGDLLARAQSVAAGLQALGVQPGQPVAVHLDRGIDVVIAIFGALLAGACYVPLDLKNPKPRLAFIVRDAKVHAVLGLGDAPAGLDASLWLDINACSEATPKPVELPADSMAAILYTSGSTGQPRGVALSHGAVASFALWAADLVALQDNDRIASSTPFFFDLSTFDLYAVLGRGASLYFVPSALILSPSRLSAWLKEQAISGWYTVPSLLAFLAYKGNLAQTPLESLRFLLFAGEVFPTPALIDLAAKLPRTALYNFFGPTETNVCCYWPVERERLVADENIPIGLPAVGCEFHIDAVTGELWVRGSSLASGYWNQGRLLPFLNEEGWYPTGDRVSLVDGECRFHGRLGRMLKCSGYRVEPAEIEAAVNAMAGVRDCAVVGIDDPAAGQRPALALVLESPATPAEIRTALFRQLPSYMQPSRCVALEELPRLPNGKLDYNQVRTLLEAQQ